LVEGPRMSQSPVPSSFEHVPVMVAEVVDLFRPVPAGVLIDATVGGGGHSAAILESCSQLTVIGLDQDPMALAAATRRFERFGGRASLRRARFDQLAPIAAGEGIPQLSGVLFDLGVSSPQLDLADRGFSFRADGPLDMRMDTDSDLTAAKVVNTFDPVELAHIIRANGEERFAARVARAIVAARPIQGTAELAEIVRSAIPAATRRHGGHPATRVFQAIRIAVNDELRVLSTALDQALRLLGPGGRCVVLSYHSGEDRIVKRAFVEAATGGCVCPPELPCQCGAVPTVTLLNRGARKPSAGEVAANHRSGSARLRAVEALTGLAAGGPGPGGGGGGGGTSGSGAGGAEGARQ
jgi:16S rRNA (cytosine1402-N4)-methyltransferase